MADFLLTSTWVPSEAVWAILLSGKTHHIYILTHIYKRHTYIHIIFTIPDSICEHDMRCSHDASATKRLFMSVSESIFENWTGSDNWRDELVPFYWSGTHIHTYIHTYNNYFKYIRTHLFCVSGSDNPP